MNAPKLRLDDLAIFGGSAAFAKLLHVGRPNIGNRERLLQRIGAILDSGWLTNRGAQVREFETQIAERLGVRHCIATCNGTIALEIAAKAAGLSGEVIVPAFTFVSIAHALTWQGITPVFCDVDPETHNLDLRHVEEMITRRTSAIIGVHLWGRPCNIDALIKTARQHGLKLLFDAAHAFGCSYQDGMIGSFGDAEVFSFHATKIFNTFEGGAVTTNDDELAAKIRLMTNFGFADYDLVVSIGINGKMTEVSAAMGLTSLESFDKFVKINCRNYKQYQQQLEAVPGISVLQYDEAQTPNYQYIVLQIDEAEAGVSRDQMQLALLSENVLARRYFYPGCHRMEPYLSSHSDRRPVLPATERLSAQVLCLPTGTAVGAAEIDIICEIIRFIIAQGPKLRERLERNCSNKISAFSASFAL